MRDKLLPLKFAVYAMGVMLLGGFLWLGGKLALKAQELNSETCMEIELPAPPDNGWLPLQSLSFQHDQWILIYQDSFNAIGFRYDKCGNFLQSFRVMGGIPPLPPLPESAPGEEAPRFFPPQQDSSAIDPPTSAAPDSAMEFRCGLAEMAADAARRALEEDAAASTGANDKNSPQN